MGPKMLVVDNGVIAETAVLLLPGRGTHASTMIFEYQKFELNSVLIGLTPPNYEWYPLPQGSQNQDAAVKGIKKIIPHIFDQIARIECEYNIPQEKIVVAGFSSGGVTALQLAANINNRSFAGVISHSGAVLDIEGLPICQKPIPILLTHCKDDTIFTWKERYLPTRLALIKKRYRVKTSECKSGGHEITKCHFRRTKCFIEEVC
jgi:predicted esterase